MASISRAMLEMYCVPDKQALDDINDSRMVGKAELECFRDTLIAILSGSWSFDYEHSDRKFDGEEFVIRARAVVPPKHRGDWSRVIYAVEDITERKRAEEALRESEARLTEAHRIAKVGHWEWDEREDRQTYASEEAERICGMSSGMLFASLDEFLAGVHADDRERVEAVMEQAGIDRSGYEVEYGIVRPDGETRFILEIADVVLDDAGELARTVGTVQDITERKQAEERIRQHEAELALVLRRGTLGEMTSALAHELNQPLAAVSTYSDACLRKLRSGEWRSRELENMLTQIREQADHAGQIMRRIRQFVQKSEPGTSPAHVNDIVDEAIKLVAFELRSNNVELTLEPEDGLPRVSVDRIEIEQVVLNLVRNSIEAMTEIEAGKRRLRIRTSKAGKNLVEVVVSDSGAGFPAELADKAFDPFFSTKPGGMGMGLPISRTIVEAHGGRISARQDAGPGATFGFTLPTNGEDRKLVA